MTNAKKKAPVLSTDTGASKTNTTNDAQSIFAEEEVHRTYIFYKRLGSSLRRELL